MARILGQVNTGGGRVLGQVQPQGNPLTGNQFEQKKPTSFLGKARDFSASIIGGGKLAEGVGQSIVAPSIQKSFSESQKTTSSLQDQLLKRLKEKRKAGEDTSRLEKAYEKSKELNLFQRDLQSDFSESLVSDKEVAGSALRLGGTLAGGALLSGVSKGGVGLQASKELTTKVSGLNKLFGVGKATTFTGGALRGAGAGATAGAVEGAVHGAGLGLEENKDLKGVAKSSALGGLVGGATGGVLGGVFGGISGKIRGGKEQFIDNITPNPKELTPKQYQEALRMNKIEPKTATTPAKYVISKGEKETATKFSTLIKKDPVKTSINIFEKVDKLDDEVGAFLETNNSIFSKGELKNSLTKAISEIDDLTVPEARLNKAKSQLINRFVDNLKKNDMKTLWKERKIFDRAIESAFSGSPSAQKEIKVAFRNSVQDFLADRTKDTVYKGFMKDMSNLLRLQKTVGIKATKERGSDAIELWIKNHPKIIKTVGWVSLLGVGSKLLPE